MPSADRDPASRSPSGARPPPPPGRARVRRRLALPAERDHHQLDAQRSPDRGPPAGARAGARGEAEPGGRARARRRSNSSAITPSPLIAGSVLAAIAIVRARCWSCCCCSTPRASAARDCGRPRARSCCSAASRWRASASATRSSARSRRTTSPSATTSLEPRRRPGAHEGRGEHGRRSTSTCSPGSRSPRG